jgi:ferric-dicitrate binding protein FerR (iron transport regulator)
MNDKTHDKLNEAVDAIKADTPTDAEISGAAERVKAAIENKRGPQTVVPSGSWDSIEDYISAIPAYLNKTLTEQQTLLFDEELRSSLPLRRALNEARGHHSKSAASFKPKSRFKTMRWLASAATIAALAFVLIAISPDLPSFNQARLAQISTVDGEIYQIVDGGLQELTPGSWIDGRQRIRSAVGSSAIITLDDGSEIEVDERSELSMTRRGSGNRIDVSRGRILVVASPQGSGTLDVFTDEFMVSVTGTIFEVAHGAKGSRVAVIEGSVDVSLEGSVSSLIPGEALGSRSEFESLNLKNEITWSQDADEYIAMLQEVSALQKDIQAAIDSPERFSTRLLNLVPENTAAYIAVPNAPEKIAEVYEVIRKRVQSSAVLTNSWAEFESSDESEHLETIMAWMHEIGDTLGDETVLALAVKDSEFTYARDAQGKDDNLTPVILSEVDVDAFRASFDKQIAQLIESFDEEGNEFEIEIVIVDDASEAVDNQLSVLLIDDLLVASADAETLRTMQANIASGSSSFVGSELHRLLESSYSQGTEILGAVNVAQFVSPFAHSSKTSEQARQALEESGISSIEYIIAQYEQQDGVTTIAADMHFAGERRGIMSLLASPGPMGSLEFFSTETTFATALLAREPVAIVEELEDIGIGSDDSTGEYDAQTEIQLFYDIVSGIGGEMAFGLDGPALPTPAWKAVIESYDEVELQTSIAAAVERFNDKAVLEDINASVTLTPSNVDGYTGYKVDLSIDTSENVPAALTSVSFNYVYVEGYLVAAANEALIDRAIGFYTSGSGLPTDREFQDLMDRDGYLNYSALFFSRLGEMMSGIMGSLPAALSEEQQQALSLIDEFDTEIGPSLTSVLALPNKIHVAHNGSSQLPTQVVSQLTALLPLIEAPRLEGEDKQAGQ